MSEITSKNRNTNKGKHISEAKIYIATSFNNTLITVTDLRGNVLVNQSAGSTGFKNARKNSAFAASRTAEEIAQKAKAYGVISADVFIKGPGAGRESALRALSAAGIIIKSISDISPLAHNGCRPPKKRRI